MYYVGLIGDKSGDIYGATAFGGTNGTGTVWELVYSKSSNFYSEKILYTFGSTSRGAANYPYGGLVMDGTGTRYGTAEQGGSTPNSGTVYKLTKSGSTWTESIVHNFAGGSSDGQDPSGNLLLGSDGNLYGMAQFGGSSNDGIVYSITRKKVKGKLRGQDEPVASFWKRKKSFSAVQTWSHPYQRSPRGSS